jgi:hypothetical protein
MQQLLRYITVLHGIYNFHLDSPVKQKLTKRPITFHCSSVGSSDMNMMIKKCFVFYCAYTQAQC